MTTKSSQIMAMHKQGKTTREIAMAIYGLAADTHHADVDRKAAYVRVVIRQRPGGGGESGADLRWRKSEHGRPVFNAKCARAMRRYYARLAQEARIG